MFEHDLHDAQLSAILATPEHDTKGLRVYR
jgi:hypothetical protein